jgi:hypothetical protein
MSEQLTLDSQPVVKQLRVFIVDEHDYYAASTAEEAIALHADMVECDTGDLDPSDCEEATGDILDKPWVDEDRAPLGTLREWLAEAKGPEWLTGTE